MGETTIEVSNLITFTKAAELLGISRPTVYNYVDRALLHPVKIGRSRFLQRDEVEDLKLAMATDNSVGEKAGQ